MKYADIIILGPTSSGKTDLANLIATHQDIPVFNCDSVQVYKGLNLLTNKPSFISQQHEKNELVSYLNPTNFLDFSRWIDFDFTLISRDDESPLLVNTFTEYKDFVLFLERKCVFKSSIEQSGKPIKNFLFDIKEPFQSYSLADWRIDINRIVENSGITSKVIAGGTLYYGYHYIFGTEFEVDFQAYQDIVALRNRISNQLIDELIQQLKHTDPEALKLLDTNNKQRVAKAVEFIERTGEKFSEKYYKKMNILPNFLLILITPKNKEKYYERLDSIVQKRMTLQALKEVQGIITKYGDAVIPWLENVSYEYKFAVALLNLIKPEDGIEDFEQSFYEVTHAGKVVSLLNELKLAERHYAKRQMTFMRKLERDLVKRYL